MTTHTELAAQAGVHGEKSDGELWSFLRSVMSQGADIHQDYLGGKYATYEHYSARLDAAASDRVDLLRAALESTERLAGGGEPVASYFLPPALHEGVVEHTPGSFTLQIDGLTVRQIKEVFEDKFLGSMMWSGGAAYPTDGVSIKFKRPTTPPPQAERVPLSDEQVEAQWDAQRGYHGREPCKLGHLAFARAIERAHGITPKEGT